MDNANYAEECYERELMKLAMEKEEIRREVKNAKLDWEEVYISNLRSFAAGD